MVNRAFLGIIYSSTTINTWLNLFTKSLSLFFLTPLVISKCTIEVANVWTLFLTIITLQNFIDVGFGVTFIRIISYAKSGYNDFTDNTKNIEKKDNSYNTLPSVIGTMDRIYLFLSVILCILLITLGTLSLYKPILQTSNPIECWQAWVILIIMLVFSILSRKYINILLGLNQVSIQKRTESVLITLSVILSFISFYFLESFLLLVLFSQSFHIIGFILYRRIIFKKTIISNFKNYKFTFNKKIFRQILPSVWKSTLGVVFSTGITQATGLIYAQNSLASKSLIYQIYLRFITAVSLFSTAPFYSKIPYLCSLRASMQNNLLISKAKQYMNYAYWAFIMGYILFDLFGAFVLNFFSKGVKFDDPLLLLLLGIAFFIERYGAMHLQLIATTNKIIWHYANGITGVIIILSLLFLTKFLPEIFLYYSYPIAFIFAYVVFYCFYSAYYSHKIFNLNFWQFEKKTFIFPLAFFLLYSLIRLIY